MTLKKKTEEQLRDFIRGHYYCDCDPDSEMYDIVWEPFEGYTEEWINDQMEVDFKSLVNFLEMEEEDEPKETN